MIAEGEVLQPAGPTTSTSRRRRTWRSTSAEDYADLAAAAAEAARQAAGGGAAQSSALRAYGFNLGLAFQLSDDALDEAGATETLRKNAGDDFREGKATLPLLLLIACTGPKEREFWDRVIGRRWTRERAISAGLAS